MTIYWLSSQFRLKPFRILIKFLDDVIRLRRWPHLWNSIFMYITKWDIHILNVSHLRTKLWLVASLTHALSVCLELCTVCLSKGTFEFVIRITKESVRICRCFAVIKYTSARGNNIFLTESIISRCNRRISCKCLCYQCSVPLYCWSVSSQIDWPWHISPRFIFPLI